MSGQLPRTIGRYLILERVGFGFGAMGAIYKGYDPALQRVACIRTLDPGLVSGPEAQAQFVRETGPLTQLSHPNIATVFDVAVDRGVPYLAQEWVDGKNVAELIREGHHFDPEAVITLASQVASAIDYAHDRGVIHRDLKPSNLIVGDDEQVKVTGFGKAKLANAQTINAGVVLGMPNYMSPEQVMGREIDERSDVFSLGVCCFEMLSGGRPFPGDSLHSILYKVVAVDPVEPANLEANGLVPQKWHEVFGKVLAKEPHDRYPTATAFSRDLESCLDPRLRPGPRPDIRLSAPDPTLTIEVAKSTSATIGRPLEAPTPPAAASTAAEGAAARAPYLDENVQFTVYRPKAIEPQRWYPLLAFAHLSERRPDAPRDEPDPLEEVARQALNVLGADLGKFQPSVQDSRHAVPAEGLIVMIPEVPGVDFNPSSRSFRWIESVHREEFHLRARAGLEGSVARGRLSVFLGSILLAEVIIGFSIRSGLGPAPGDSSKYTADRAVAYRKIFPSYSHRDLPIVVEFERYARALGDHYLRDSVELRAGEVWTERLSTLIGQADVFQLFWSSNSMRSPFVRHEWEHALSLGRTGFIRPMYWEEPIPNAPQEGLPPPELTRLHFQWIPRNPAPPMPRSAAVPPRTAATPTAPTVKKAELYPPLPASPSDTASMPRVPRSTSMPRSAPVQRPAPAGPARFPLVGFLLAALTLITIGFMLFRACR